jgi:hypothetical protein
LPKNNKTGIVGEEKEAFTFGRKVASASGENSVHLHRNTHHAEDLAKVRLKRFGKPRLPSFKPFASFLLVFGIV